MIVNSWSVSVRHMWKLPYETHRYFIEPLGGMHAKIMILTRYITFVQSISKTTKKAALYLLQRTIYNQQTITGKNVRLILIEIDDNDILELKVNKVKKSLKFYEIPENNEWKIDLIKELVDIKMNNLVLDFDDREDVKISDIDKTIHLVSTS